MLRGQGRSLRSLRPTTVGGSLPLPAVAAVQLAIQLGNSVMHITFHPACYTARKRCGSCGRIWPPSQRRRRGQGCEPGFCASREIGG